MLAASDLTVIVLTALACTAVVTGISLFILRRRGGLSLGTRFAVVAGTAVLSIVASTVAIASEMYLSEHDLLVFFWVVGIAAVLSLGATWLIVRAAHASLARVSASARTIGAGEVVADRGVTGWREFDELSAALAASSERLAATRAEADRLDASRRQLVAWVAHDLRTPLAGVRAMAESLEEGTAPDPEAYIGRIREQVDVMSRMVDGLFELSRIHSGALRLNREPIVLLDLVSDAVADMRPLAAERGIRIIQTGMGDQMLIADPHELTRVVANLLANSIRHAPQDSEIVVSSHREADGRIVLSVLDHGPGVASQDLGRMFDVGWRGDEARTLDRQASASSGAGLGLAIVQGIVEAHGGRVEAQHVDDGFRLDVVLPDAAAGGGRPQDSYS